MIEKIEKAIVILQKYGLLICIQNLEQKTYNIYYNENKTISEKDKKELMTFGFLKNNIFLIPGE